MKRTKIVKTQIWLAISTALFACASATLATAQTETVIHRFAGGTADGETPHAGLIADSTGTLYGTAAYAGLNSQGIVYQLTPSGSGVWAENIIYSFTGTTDGSVPASNLIMDSTGQIYGTTTGGGAFNCGTFFRLVPPSGGGPWTENTLHSFDCEQNGHESVPGNIVLDQDTGIFYGAVQNGGSFFGGYVYELAPASGGNWTFASLHNFNLNSNAPGYANGCTPWSLILSPSGGLYGTAIGCGAGGGTVFRLTPPSMGTNWKFALLYQFGSELGSPTGFNPFGLVVGKGGVLYGTAAYGGSADAGIVYALTPNRTGTPWTETVIYNFTGSLGDGNTPLAGVILGPAGSLYGTTSGGGSSENNCGFDIGCGTVFQLTPNGSGWTETLLHDFSATGEDGINPNPGGLLQHGGVLYGATYNGGVGNYYGVVYAIRP